MEKNKKYMVNNTLCIVGVVYILFLFAIGISLITIHRYVSAAIFMIATIPFFVLVWRYGSYVQFDDKGVALYFLGIKKKSFTWNKIKEVEVCGTKLLNIANRDKAGTLYIFFSKQSLNDKERMDMLMNWPPKNMIYMKFTKERLMDLQWHWTRPVQKFNIGNLDI